MWKHCLWLHADDEHCSPSSEPSAQSSFPSHTRLRSRQAEERHWNSELPQFSGGPGEDEFLPLQSNHPPTPRSPPNIAPTARLSPVHTIRMPPSWQRDGFQVLQHLLAELGSHAQTQQAAGAPLKPSAFSPCTYTRPHHCRPCSHPARHSARAQARTGLHWHRATASSHSEAPRGHSPEETASDLVNTTCIQSPEGSSEDEEAWVTRQPSSPFCNETRA